MSLVRSPLTCSLALLVACASAPKPAVEPLAPAPAADVKAAPMMWAEPEVLVAPSSFKGIHGLAIDAQGRLLAGTVIGADMWEVDRKTGQARVFIPAPQGEADDIAIGPKGELAWTSYLQGIIRYRESETAPIRELARDLAGINSLAFDAKSGKLYASQVFYGDALWEIDVSGQTAPRQISKDMGGFNGFEVGPDGMLYGPLWFKGQVVKIHPKTGKLTVINSEFKTPAAVNLDGRGGVWVIDTQTGELCRVELKSGKKSVLKQLATSLDNLAVAPEGTVYVSNMADNSIEAVDPTSGDVQVLTRGKLAAPGALKLDGDTLYVADIFAFRALDTKSGEVRDVLRAHGEGSHLEYPSSVGVGGKFIALASWGTNSVQLIDRATQQQIEVVHGFKAPTDAIPMDDGTLLVAEIATGTILRAQGEHYAERTPLVQGLLGPTQMVLGQDGALYVLEAAGNLKRVDLGTAAVTVVASAMALPDGIALTPSGTLIVAESGAKRLLEIDPAVGARRTIAENLPIGYAVGREGLPPPYLPTGVAVAPDGTIYVSADQNNSLLRLRPRP
jgi:sugar lactone lactonase YvrE